MLSKYDEFKKLWMEIHNPWVTDMFVSKKMGVMTEFQKREAEKSKDYRCSEYFGSVKIPWHVLVHMMQFMPPPISPNYNGDDMPTIQLALTSTAMYNAYLTTIGHISARCWILWIPYLVIRNIKSFTIPHHIPFAERECHYLFENAINLTSFGTLGGWDPFFSGLPFNHQLTRLRLLDSTLQQLIGMSDLFPKITEISVHCPTKEITGICPWNLRKISLFHIGNLLELKLPATLEWVNIYRSEIIPISLREDEFQNVVTFVGDRNNFNFSEFYEIRFPNLKNLAWGITVDDIDDKIDPLHIRSMPTLKNILIYFHGITDIKEIDDWGILRDAFIANSPQAKVKLSCDLQDYNRYFLDNSRFPKIEN
jgi:hypothetical protein